MATMQEQLSTIEKCNDYSAIFKTFCTIDSRAKWIFYSEDACKRAFLSDPHSLTFRYCLEDFGRTISRRCKTKPFGWWKRDTELEQFKHACMQCCLWQDLGNFRNYHTNYGEFVGVEINTPEKIAKIEKLRLQYWEKELGLTPGKFTIEPLRVRKFRARKNGGTK